MIIPAMIHTASIDSSWDLYTTRNPTASSARRIPTEIIGGSSKTIVSCFNEIAFYKNMPLSFSSQPAAFIYSPAGWHKKQIGLYPAGGWEIILDMQSQLFGPSKRLRKEKRDSSFLPAGEHIRGRDLPGQQHISRGVFFLFRVILQKGVWRCGKRDTQHNYSTNQICQKSRGGGWRPSCPRIRYRQGIWDPAGGVARRFYSVKISAEEKCWFACG